MNILLNTYCNLKCSYCFASDTMTHCKDDNMSCENFDYILNFLKNNNITTVKLLGGEPTLHPNFNYFLSKVVNEKFFREMILFSNLTFDDNILETILLVGSTMHLHILPNWNIENISENNYNRMLYNLDKICTTNPNIIEALGVNLHNPAMDISPIIELVKKYKLGLRWAISAPNKTIESTFNLETYGRSFYPLLKHLFSECIENKIYNYNDCNTIPPCVFTDEQFRDLLTMQPDSIIKKNVCKPVIDVQPNLDVIRCFGVSDIYKTNLKIFNKYNDLYDTLVENCNSISDSILFDKCKSCNIYKKNKKSCGCLAYRKNTL